MAGKKPAKEKKSGGTGGVLPKILSVISMLCASVLFVAALDLGQLGLGKMMGVLAAIPLALYVLLGIAATFMIPKGAGDVLAANDSSADFSDFQSKVASRFSSIENSIDMLSGSDKEALMEENKKLKEQLDAIHQLERDKVDEELEMLRKQNEELEEQIKQWARKSVENAVSGEVQAA